MNFGESKTSISSYYKVLAFYLISQKNFFSKSPKALGDNIIHRNLKTICHLTQTELVVSIPYSDAL